MAIAAVLAPHDVPTSLNYYTPIGTEEPYQYVLAPPEGKEPNNLGVEPHDVTVHDARGREAEFSLDKNGFQFVKYPSAEKEFDSDERIKEVYYPEVEKILKEVAGAKRVFIFDHTLRYVQSPGVWACLDQFTDWVVLRTGASPTRARRRAPLTAAQWYVPPFSGCLRAPAHIYHRNACTSTRRTTPLSSASSTTSPRRPHVS